MGPVVGRAAELAAVEALLGGAETALAALVLEGEAGIGKTTVWLAGVERAAALGHEVMVCRPAETEAALPFVSLGDLLEPILIDVFPALSPLQRLALDTALARIEPVESFDRLAVSRAALAAIRHVASRRPVLLAIDDVQWLDASSADVLEFVVRRLLSLPVRLLVARRSERELPPPLHFAKALPPERLTTTRIAPLSTGDLDRLLRSSLGLALPRPRLVELQRISGGNPFYALEIARILARRGAGPPDEITVPNSLADLLRERLAELSATACHSILLASAAAQPQTRVVERAAGGSEGLSEAISQGILELEGTTLRFSHPLLGSVTYGSAAPWEQRDAHLRLARAERDDERRARHLALGTEEPDETVAGELEKAAKLAAARGAPASAALLAEHAARLTPPGQSEDEGRRLVSSAGHHTAAGDAPRGRAILESLAGQLPAGPERADVLWRLADLTSDDLDEAVALCRQALVEAGGNPDVEAEVHLQLAVYSKLAYDLPEALAHCEQVLERAERLGNDRLLATALANAAYVAAVLGRSEANALIVRAVELEPRVVSFPAFLRPSFIHGWTLMLADELDQARPLLHGELERLAAAGQEATRAGAFYPLIELELRAGNWGIAEQHAREAVTLAQQASVEQELGALLIPQALVAAHLGHVGDARTTAERALRRAEAGGDVVVDIRARGVLGFVELSVGAAAAAADWLGPALDRLIASEVAELSSYGVVQNHIEALVTLGELDRAAEVVLHVEHKGRPLDRAWHAVVAARGRALIAAARGDFSTAQQALTDAFAAHRRLPQPFELGRTLLVQGSIERRAKHRREARVALTGALELFDQLGAPLWAEKAAAELSRIPGRGRASSELSETERRVGELVAQGLSNKEIAATLFVTVRTVEANLTKVYAKLGVRSRTELAGRLTARP